MTIEICVRWIWVIVFLVVPSCSKCMWVSKEVQQDGYIPQCKFPFYFILKWCSSAAGGNERQCPNHLFQNKTMATAVYCCDDGSFNSTSVVGGIGTNPVLKNDNTHGQKLQCSPNEGAMTGGCSSRSYRYDCGMNQFLTQIQCGGLRNFDDSPAGSRWVPGTLDNWASCLDEEVATGLCGGGNGGCVEGGISYPKLVRCSKVLCVTPPTVTDATPQDMILTVHADGSASYEIRNSSSGIFYHPNGVFYKCDRGYAQDKSPAYSNPVSRCNRNGYWSAPMTRCNLFCNLTTHSLDTSDQCNRLCPDFETTYSSPPGILNLTFSTAAKRQQQTMVQISCNLFPVYVPTGQLDFTCTSGAWSPQPPPILCKCNVMCESNECLGNNILTSIANLTATMIDQGNIKLQWTDSCFQTSTQAYKIQIWRRYRLSSGSWSSLSTPTNGFLQQYTIQQLTWTDNTFSKDVPNLSPGTTLQYFFQQQTNYVTLTTNQYNFQTTSNLSSMSSAEVLMQFYGNFQVKVTTADDQADIEGAFVQVFDLNGSTPNTPILNWTTTTGPNGNRISPPVMTLIQPWSTTTRWFRVNVTLQNHDIVCYSCQNGSQALPISWSGVVESGKPAFMLRFIDRSGISLKGRVVVDSVYTCGIPGVTISVRPINGVEKNFTAAPDGRFVVYFTSGTTIFRAIKDGFDFGDSQTYTFTSISNVQDILFTTTTRRRLTLSVVGGSVSCNASIGSGFVQVQDATGLCWKRNYAVSATPQTYDDVFPILLTIVLITHNRDSATQWTYPQGSEWKFANSHFDKYIEYTNQGNGAIYDLRTTSQTVVFRYHSRVLENMIAVSVPDAINLSTLEGCSSGYTAICDGGNRLISGANLFGNIQANSALSVQFRFTEQYADKTCASVGFIVIQEDWSSQNGRLNQSAPLQLNEYGEVSYEITAGSPEFSCPYLKRLNYRLVVNDTLLPAVPQASWSFFDSFQVQAVIHGMGVESAGQDYTTIPGVIAPLMIIRDPPGDLSFTTFSKSNSMSFGVDMRGSTTSGFSTDGKFTAGFQMETGIGFAVEASAWTGMTGGLQAQKTLSSSNSMQFTMTTSTDITSSTDPSIPGRYGDVIMGLGFNVNVLKCNQVKFNWTTCQARVNKAIGFDASASQNPVSSSSQAVYVYSHYHIEFVILPQLQQIISTLNNTNLNGDDVKQTQLQGAINSYDGWRQILDNKDASVHSAVDLFSSQSSFWKQFQKVKNATDELFDMYDTHANGLQSAVTTTTAAIAGFSLGMIGSLNVIGASLFAKVNSDFGDLIRNIDDGGEFTNEAMKGKFEELRSNVNNFTKAMESFKQNAMIRGKDGNPLSRLSISGGQAYTGSVFTSSSKSLTSEFTVSLDSSWGSYAEAQLAVLKSDSSVSFSAALEITRSGTTSSEESKGYSYTIQDANLGDYFEVDIKEDPEYGTPVFSMSKGKTSCPYEGVPSVAREGVSMTIEGVDIYVDTSDPDMTVFVKELVPADMPAVFILKMKHTGDDDSGTYRVRLVRSNQQDGRGLVGQVYLGGSSLTNYMDFVDMPKDQWVLNELVVHRAYTSFAVERLTVEIYSVCEEAMWPSSSFFPTNYISDSVALTIRWIATCAEVQIEPEFDTITVRNGATQNYPIRIVNPVASMKPWKNINGLQLKLQWRYSIPGASDADYRYVQQILNRTQLGEATAEFMMDLAQFPMDAKLDIRVHTYCPDLANPNQFTPVKTMVLGLTPLAVFGRPYPADDATLQINDLFSVRFTRDLLCYNPLLVYQVFVQNISSPDLKISVPVNVICSGSTLVFAFALKADFEAIMGKRLKALVYGVMDVTGNWLNGAQEQSVSWTFFAPSVDLAQQSVRLSMAISGGTSMGQPGSFQLTVWKQNLLSYFVSILDVALCRLECSDPYVENFIKKVDLIIRPVQSSPNCQTTEKTTPYEAVQNFASIVENLTSSARDTTGGDTTRRRLLSDTSKLSTLNFSQPVYYRFGENVMNASTPSKESCNNGRTKSQTCDSTGTTSLCCKAPLTCAAGFCSDAVLTVVPTPIISPSSSTSSTSSTPNMNHDNTGYDAHNGLLVFVVVLQVISIAGMVFQKFKRRIGSNKMDSTFCSKLFGSKYNPNAPTTVQMIESKMSASSDKSSYIISDKTSVVIKI